MNKNGLYRVLLIDDEKTILDGLSKLVPWEDYGFEVVDTASSGEEGYKKIFTRHPDLVITDMRMEDLTGLDLLKMISQNYPHIKSAVISGYEDFTYARGALQYGAVDYLLKPVKRKELTDLLITVHSQLTAERSSSDETVDEESISILRSRFLIGACKGEIRDKGTIEREAKKYGIDLSWQDYRLLIIDLDFVDINNDNDTYIKDNVELIRFACANIIESTLEASCKHLVFYSFESRIYAVIQQGQMDDPSLKVCLEKMKRRIANFVKMPLTIGVSQRCEDLFNIQEAYTQALTTLKYKLIFGRNTLIYHEDVTAFTKNTFSMPVDIEKKIVSAMLYGNRQDLIGLADELLEDLIEQKVAGSVARDECNSVLRLCHHSASEMGIDIHEVVAAGMCQMEKVFDSGSIDGVRESFKSVLIQMMEAMLSHMSNSYGDIIVKICDYINNNFHEEINLNRMSEKFFISPSYISKLFKEHTDGNFIDYLIQIRISEAKKLLAGTDLKIYEIAERVGYSNPKYFSQLFMKHAGMTPRAYRENVK